MRVCIDDCSELRPGSSTSVLALRLAAADPIVEADVAGFESGGVYGRDRS
jgi:hypothetical protein